MKKRFLLLAVLPLLLASCGETTPNQPQDNEPQQGDKTPSDDPSGKPDDGQKPDGGDDGQTIQVQYTIIFKDENDQVLDSKKWNEGTIPSYTYNKQDTAEWDYTVQGWASSLNGEVITIPAANADATYWAVVSKVKQQYSIAFFDENGTQLQSNSLEYGAQPSCNYAGPSDTAEWNYTFTGWSLTLGGAALASIPTVSANVNYYAAVSKTKQRYSVNFYDEDGTLLETVSYAYGDIPSYTYTKQDTQEWDYTVLGWATSADGEPLSALPAVTGNASYYIRINAVKQRYTITFVSNGDTSVPSITEDYGTEVAKPDNPQKEGHHFAGWSTDQAGNNKVEWPFTLTKDETFYGNWNETVNLKLYFQTLIEALSHDPYEYIPNQMKPGYLYNRREESNLTKDYSGFQNVNSIEFGGHGEQWNMVVTNLDQSETFYKVLSTGSEVITAATVAVNNWIDTNPSDIASHNISNTQYNVKISYQSKVLKYTLQFKTGWNIPVVGSITPQIDMTYDINNGTKTFRIQLNESNAIKYIVSDGYYAFGMELAIEIAGKVGSRKAYFEINSDENNEEISGHIYEFLTYQKDEGSEEKTVLPSCADFYMNVDYVSVVGNKASGLTGFEGYITELYDRDDGKLYVYKVEETFEKWSISKTYNTLFFNLENISNINSIKAISNGSVDPHENNHDVYINGKDTKFVATRNKVAFVSTSRKYDIEMRKQYFYSLNSGGEIVKHEVLTPMMFIQDDGENSGETNYSTFETDILKDNSVSASVNLDSSYLTKVRSDYLTLIPQFKENKELQNSETISNFVGSAETI